MMEDFDIQRVNEQFEGLYEITKTQDKIQLGISSLTECIAISKRMTNDANALILEASKWKGNLIPQVRHGYTREKVLLVVGDYNALVHDYNITHATNIPILVVKEEKRFSDKMFEELKNNKKLLKKNWNDVFGELEFKNNKWVRGVK